MSIPENFPASSGGQSEFRDQLVSAALRIATSHDAFGQNAGGFSTFFVVDDQEYSIRVRPVQITAGTTFGARIKALRRGRDMTMCEVADACGVSLVDYSAIERDVLEPYAHVRQRIEKFLRTDPKGEFT